MGETNFAPSTDALQRARAQARNDLLAARDERGVWTGQLSSSALSTATAVSALATYFSPGSADYSKFVAPAITWLVRHQNTDGGWGDTELSHSNISTTMLVQAALSLAGAESGLEPQLCRASEYLTAEGGIEGLRARYGRDKTFAVPILANAAIAGQVPWSQVSPLPFELAWLPQSLYRFARLPVVSYAIPALVAVGQAVHHANPSRNPLIRRLRDAAIEPTLEVLHRIQPESGGYLEAIPLTSFVAMSLISCGRRDHVVTRNCIRFITDTVREDGSWPIDTNLATWNSTLSMNALLPARNERPGEHQFSADERTRLITWLLDCQNTVPHPFTGAAPGGWGWSDLAGAVPDADDTPGALLALRMYCDDPQADGTVADRCRSAAKAGTKWLLELQNRDGGWPTFCRGWGKLPFDRSGTDLTAHALRAIHAWRNLQPSRMEASSKRGWEYLTRHQNDDGSWTPLWFGNQHHPDEQNPVYGTSKCLVAYAECGRWDDATAQRARDWLSKHQNSDGGWGGNGTESSVEETALAVAALSAAGPLGPCDHGCDAIERGVNWLISAVERQDHVRASPIGLYFAKLWYYESTYPLAFTVSALESWNELLTSQTNG